MGDVVTRKDGEVSVRIEVRAASWIGTDRLRIFVDGRVHAEIPLSNASVLRHAAEHEISCKQDCFVTAMVDSDQSLEPVIARRPDLDPKPTALSNPIFVDVDGDGRYKGSP